MNSSTRLLYLRADTGTGRLHESNPPLRATSQVAKVDRDAYSWALAPRFSGLVKSAKAGVLVIGQCPSLTGQTCKSIIMRCNEHRSRHWTV